MKKYFYLCLFVFLVGCSNTANTNTSQNQNTGDQRPTVDQETINKAYQSQIKQNRYKADIKRELKDIESK